MRGAPAGSSSFWSRTNSATTGPSFAASCSAGWSRRRRSRRSHRTEVTSASLPGTDGREPGMVVQVSESDDLYVGGIQGQRPGRPVRVPDRRQHRGPAGRGLLAARPRVAQLARRHRRRGARGRVARPAPRRGGARGLGRHHRRRRAGRARRPAGRAGRGRPPGRGEGRGRHRRRPRGLRRERRGGRDVHRGRGPRGGPRLMQLTKFTHACVRLDDGDRTLVLDPGAFSEVDEALDGADAILITHEHADHIDADKVRAALQGDSRLRLWAPNSVTGAARRPRRAGRHRRRRASPSTRRGSRCARFGGQHALIHASIPVVQNLGYPRRRHGVPPRRLVHRAVGAGARAAAADHGAVGEGRRDHRLRDLGPRAAHVPGARLAGRAELHRDGRGPHRRAPPNRSASGSGTSTRARLSTL